MKRFMALLIAAIMLAATSASIWADSDSADALPAEDETTAAVTEPEQDEPAAPAEDDFDDAELTAAATNRVEYTDDNIIGGNIYYNPASGTIVDCDTNVVSCVIPEEIDGVAITSIGSYAFKETSVMRITIPESVTKIGMQAFYNSDLRDIVVPESVTSIEGYAFSHCDALKTVKILGNASLESYVFYNDSVLEEADISNVISLGTHTFGLCDALYKVNYPQNLDVIPDITFYLCSSLKDFVISENVKRIGASAFDHAGLAGNFEIPSNVIEIGNTAFSANDIVTLTINANIKVIPQSAFSWNADLVSVRIGEGIVGIETHAFYMNNGCSLDTVYLPSTLEYIVQDAFYGGRVNVQNLHYAGCETKWQNILIASGNDSLTKEAAMHFADHHNIYKNDETSHWLACEYCGTVSGEKSAHEMKGDVCAVCGYGAPEEHVHSYVYKSDVNVHWQYCEACGDTCNVEEHTFENGTCKYCGSAKAAGGLNGDMDNDGKITLNDAVLVLKIAMKVA